MNKTDMENDFKKRYGNGAVHTCFVPLPLIIMGSGCCLNGGSTLIAAMNAGVWVCARIHSSDMITIGSTSCNTSVSAPFYRSIHEKMYMPYKMLFSLARRFGADCGFDVLFHCDIPECSCIDTELSYCTASALIMQNMFSDKKENIPSIVSELAENKSSIYVRALLSARRNCAVFADGDSEKCECVPICPDGAKIICTYPQKKSLQKFFGDKRQNISSPLPLNEIKLDSVSNKSGELYSLILSSQNTLAAFKTLKNSGTDSFFTAFSDKCDIEGCIGKLESDTDIYFAEENKVDYIMNEINRMSPIAPSFIITNCGNGAQIM